MARGGPHRGGGGYRVFTYPPPKSFIPGSIGMILGSEFFLFFSLISYPGPIPPAVSYVVGLVRV
ncbi:uncharacterized protein BDW43DRAFT_295174 [Aspergillus alliaceus]|uniref:uncharacterized protein n=1 Tax=Petromyces alliaceus TaxID=209559 RepID=UPI0012A44627|nr:uncharacterized protein BDW43DRAFT_295174 [Aspergillus alliaceus]KAB8226983.1 hypothetical protein BDW43DRAFT_295174 [Aspergillus alliaceus]